MTPELAATLDIADDAHERIAAEPRSKATFELEPLGDVVKLTVIHDGFGPDSLMAGVGRRGWPRGLSGLQSPLQTGAPPATRTQPPAPAPPRLTTSPPCTPQTRCPPTPAPRRRPASVSRRATWRPGREAGGPRHAPAPATDRRLLPAADAVDVPLAVAIIALGVLAAAAPATVPGL